MTTELRSRVVNVAQLPTYGYSHRSLVWWGTAGMIAIEGTVFALAALAYFYIRTRIDQWPPSALAPELTFGTANLLVMLSSAIPNHWTKKVAEHEDLPKVRIGLVICLAFSAAFIVLRAFEFTALNCRWDTNAYGSAVWMLLALHTIHVATDFYDSAVLTVLSFTGPWEGKRFVDVSEGAIYWYFVVFAWIPIYAIIYLGPR